MPWGTHVLVVVAAADVAVALIVVVRPQRGTKGGSCYECSADAASRVGGLVTPGFELIPGRHPYVCPRTGAEVNFSNAKKLLEMYIMKVTRGQAKLKAKKQDRMNGQVQPRVEDGTGRGLRLSDALADAPEALDEIPCAIWLLAPRSDPARAGAIPGGKRSPSFMDVVRLVKPSGRAGN